jgi:hypothetical protein
LFYTCTHTSTIAHEPITNHGWLCLLTHTFSLSIYQDHVVVHFQITNIPLSSRLPPALPHTTARRRTDTYFPITISICTRTRTHDHPPTHLCVLSNQVFFHAHSQSPTHPPLCPIQPGVLSPHYKGFVPAAVSPFRPSGVSLDSPSQEKAFASFVGRTPRRDSPSHEKKFSGDNTTRIELLPFKLKQI